MVRDPVMSSNIVSIGYDEATETLEVEFLSGAVYQYFNVGVAAYESLRQAPSKGQHFNIYIKTLYPFSRV